MSDIDNLRQRIENAELRLKTAHTTRQRESAALMTMWDQIRDRFAAQSTEIVRLRERVAGLEDNRDALNGMVRTLLGAVENSIERMSDETVPEITGLAEALLDSDPSFIAANEPGEVETAPATDDVALSAPAGMSGDDEDRTGEDSAMLLTTQVDDEVPDLPPPPRADQDVDDEPVSPGIRSLISRIEGAFERKPAGPSAMVAEQDEAAAPHDEDLTRDLDDIRRLREELQTLRTRIGAGR